jgi:hypothetical protein
MIIAWDVDDTLILPSVATGLPIDTPNYDLIAVYRWFQAQGHTMCCWSGGGVDYARMWAEKLGLKPDKILVKEKTLDMNGKPYVDLCFDDCNVDLAAINIQVKRFENGVSRKEWNKH